MAWSDCEGTCDCAVGSCAFQTTSRMTRRGVLRRSFSFWVTSEARISEFKCGRWSLTRLSSTGLPYTCERSDWRGFCVVGAKRSVTSFLAARPAGAGDMVAMGLTAYVGDCSLSWWCCWYGMRPRDLEWTSPRECPAKRWREREREEGLWEDEDVVEDAPIIPRNNTPYCIIYTRHNELGLHTLFSAPAARCPHRVALDLHTRILQRASPEER